MEWVETTGRSVDEAKEVALDRLGVDETEAEIDVIDEPRFGLFGRLRSEARIRARVRPTAPRPKVDRRDRRRRRRTDDDSEGDSHRRPVRSEATSARGNGAGINDGGGDRVGNQTAPMRAGDHGGDGGTAMEVSLEEQGDVARQFLDGLVDEMDLDAQVSTNRLDEETIELRVDGSDLGLLIGAKGTTLVALQDLTRTVVQRRTGAGNGRLLVDVSGYRQKRKEALERFAHQLAEEVKARGARKVLEPMSAPDRKIVHDTVNALDGVTTTSEGEEPRRRVIILPSPR